MKFSIKLGISSILLISISTAALASSEIDEEIKTPIEIRLNASASERDHVYLRCQAVLSAAHDSLSFEPAKTSRAVEDASKLAKNLISSGGSGNNRSYAEYEKKYMELFADLNKKNYEMASHDFNSCLSHIQKLKGPSSETFQTCSLTREMTSIRAAGDGDLEQQLTLGVKNASGFVCSNKVDGTKAVYWYEKAAKQGSGEAMRYLGDMYDLGREEFPKDAAKAFDWYKKAAEAGGSLMQHKVALRYFNGQGVEKDYGQTASWMYKAASQGNPESIQQLGLAYQFGIGVAVDQNVALNLLAIAKEIGNENAKKSFAELQATMPNIASALAETQAKEWAKRYLVQNNVTGKFKVPPLPVPPL
jgi:TPR repeat protein